MVTGPLLKYPEFAYFPSERPPTPQLPPHRECTSPLTTESQLCPAGTVVAAEGQGQGNA